MITIDQLNKSETLEKVKEIAQDYIIHEAMPESWNLINKLEPQTRDLIDSSPEIYKQYQKLLVQLKFVAITFQADDQILELIRKFFLTALKEGLDIERRIRVYLASKSVFNRDQFKRDILSSLKQNQEKIENKTIGEWLLSYDKFAGARKNTAIERMKFITQDLDVKKLSEESKQLLLKILEFYDNFKITVPVPIIGVSEVTLREYFEEMGIPIEEGKRPPLPIRPVVTPPPPEIKKEVRPTPLDFEEKPKKPGLFKRLFRKKPEGPEGTKMQKEILTEFPKTYEKEISPYEKKRPLTIPRLIIPLRKPPGLEEIKPFPEEVRSEPKPARVKEEEAQKIKPSAPITIPPYKIRTMKTDLEKAKKEPASQRGEPIPEKPKIYDNTVDLSGK